MMRSLARLAAIGVCHRTAEAGTGASGSQYLEAKENMPPFTELTLLGVLFAALLGSLIGSFANVVVHRLPKGESIAFPGSHCPACNHRLSPLELIPVISWVVQSGRCRSCRAPVSVRYPLIELIMAIGFVLLWLRWPPVQLGWGFVALAALFAVLVILSAIDIDTFTLPDVLTLPALALALLATLIYPAGVGMPTFAEALTGAAVGAGILSLVNRIGALVIRRFADTRERLWPFGFDQVNLAALGGAIAGWLAGIVVATLSLLANLLIRRPLRLSEPLTYLLWAVAILLAGLGLTVPVLEAVGGSVIAAGAAAVTGALFWWLHDLWARGRSVSAAGDGSPAAGDRGSLAHTAKEAYTADQADLVRGAGNEATETKVVKGANEAQAIGEDDDAAGEEPVAMGFGDVKLAAVMGAMLGPAGLLLALFLSFLVGAVGGLTLRALGGDRMVPFGPYLVLSALISLFFGDAILTWYLGLLGV